MIISIRMLFFYIYPSARLVLKIQVTCNEKISVLLDTGTSIFINHFFLLIFEIIYEDIKYSTCTYTSISSIMWNNI